MIRPVLATMQKPAGVRAASSRYSDRRNQTRRVARARSRCAWAARCREGSRLGSSFSARSRLVVRSGDVRVAGRKGVSASTIRAAPLHPPGDGGRRRRAAIGWRSWFAPAASSGSRSVAASPGEQQPGARARRGGSGCEQAGRWLPQRQGARAPSRSVAVAWPPTAASGAKLVSRTWIVGIAAIISERRRTRMAAVKVPPEWPLLYVTGT